MLIFMRAPCGLAPAPLLFMRRHHAVQVLHLLFQSRLNIEAEGLEASSTLYTDSIDSQL